MHLDHLIIDLAIIFQKIHQPVVLGYILAGLIVGPHTPPVKLIIDTPSIRTLAELGMIFLMFTLGLEFSFRKLLSVGVTAGLAAGLEVIFFLGVGYGIGQVLGWSVMDSIFLGAILSISSTTIIIKALDELKLKSHRFAHLIFGILIVEDLFAILLLVGLTTIATNQSTFSALSLLTAVVNLVMVIGGWFIIGYFLVPRLMTYLGRRGSNELVTIVALGLCLSLVVAASHLGYSPALGAFIMGSIIAETKMVHRIEGLMAPLKDVFGAIFFVSIGMLIDPLVIWQFKGTILLLSAVTIFGKIFITSVGSMLSGQTIKNSLQVGMALAQIGEFSFIIAGLGVALNATSSNLYPIAVAVSLITTFTTPYLIKHSGILSDRMEGLLPMSLRRAMGRYVLWCEQKAGTQGKKSDYVKLIARWCASGIIVTFVFNFCNKKVTPFFELEQPWPAVIAWGLAFLASAPFIWAMVFISRKHYVRIRLEKDFTKAVLIFTFPVMTAIWMTILTAKFFPLGYALAINCALVTVIYFVLFKRLETSYRWFEKAFLETFEKREGGTDPHHAMARLAPWNSHMVNISVHANADFVGLTLAETGMRSKFSVNIVAIQRGAQSIIAPRPTEKILPNDTLVVLGEDAQLEKLRPFLEMPKDISTRFNSSRDYGLKQFHVRETSSLLGQSIHGAGFTEKYQALVVGIERNAIRTMNPDGTVVIIANDVVWLVGEKTKLEELAKDFT